MAFSRQAKARKLKRALSDLKAQHSQELRKVRKEEATSGLVPSTPEQQAIKLMVELDVTPLNDRIQMLVPYVETVARVAKAKNVVKKQLFRPSPDRRYKGRARVLLSKKVQYSRSLLYQKGYKNRNRRALIMRSTKTLINEYLKRPENSYEMPGKKDQVRGNGKFGLIDTLQNIYQKFRTEKTELSISFASFCKARDPTIKLINWTALRTGICKIHANIHMLSQAAKVLPKSGQELCAMSDDMIEDKLASLPEIVSFRNWGTLELIKDGKTIKNSGIIDCQLPRDEFIEKFIGQMMFFRPHSKRIFDIYGELHHLKSNMMPMAEAVLQLDFSENWAHKFQDEISAFYFDNQQITVHPMVLNYRNEENNLLCRTFAGISSETSHSVPTVFSFIQAIMSFIRHILPELKIIHFVSDSPSSQYRNRTICSIISRFSHLFEVDATWTWLEAGHGKGPCDGVGGAIKKKIDNVIKAGRLVRNIDEMHEALTDANVKPTILQVSKEYIGTIKDKLSKCVIPPAKGLMEAHSIINHNSQLKMRNIPCFRLCCYSPGGNVHPTCDGWRNAFTSEVNLQALEKSATTQVVTVDPVQTGSEVNRQALEKSETERVVTVDPVPTGSEGKTNGNKAGEIEMITNEDQNVEPNKRSLEIGSFVAIDYGRRWYVAEVRRITKDGSYEVAYMAPCHGKWGQEDLGLVTEENILLNISKPRKIGNLFALTAVEIKVVNRKFKNRK